VTNNDAYQILFSIPQIKSALLMGPEGGGQLKIEFDQTSRAAIVAILDRATARGGCVFAAAVVEVEPPAQEEPEPPEVRGWKEPKVKN